VRLFVLSRHGESTLNLEHRINGDPAVPAALSELGREQARRLGVQVAHLPLDLCVTTRFPRTHETARIALEGRDVPFVQEPLLDDVRIGELEGRTIDEYRAWKRDHHRSDPFPGGESLDDAAARYARGFRALLALDAETVLVVCHEIPIRYALNAAAGSDDVDGPEHDVANATPYLFEAAALERAAARLEQLLTAAADTTR
jgi:broad specificity phosphatase PhoE